MDRVIGSQGEGCGSYSVSVLGWSKTEVRVVGSRRGGSSVSVSGVVKEWSYDPRVSVIGCGIGYICVNVIIAHLGGGSVSGSFTIIYICSYCIYFYLYLWLL